MRNNVTSLSEHFYKKNMLQPTLDLIENLDQARKIAKADCSENYTYINFLYEHLARFASEVDHSWLGAITHTGEINEDGLVTINYGSFLDQDTDKPVAAITDLGAVQGGLLKTDLKIAQLVRTIPVKHKDVNCFLLPLVTSFFYLIHANEANILSIDIEGDHDVISLTFVIDKRKMKLVINNLELHRVADSFEKLKEECADEF